MLGTIISADDLMSLITGPSSTRPVLFDTRFKLDDSEYGEQSFAKEPIPFAYYLDLDRDLAGPITRFSGRHPLPDVEQFVATMRQHGVSSDTQVIVYDDAGGMFAARLWWLLKWLGHDKVAVLDGGWQAWIKRGGPVTDRRDPLPNAGSFSANPRADMLVTADQVVAGLAEGSLTLCDARAPERFRGEVEPLDKVAGHVPGAVNVPFIRNLDADKCFHSPEILRSHHADSASGHVVHMCGSGVTACHNVLAYAIAGLPLPKLYAGSWSEWIRDPNRGVATAVG